MHSDAKADGDDVSRLKAAGAVGIPSLQCPWLPPRYAGFFLLAVLLEKKIVAEVKMPR